MGAVTVVARKPPTPCARSVSAITRSDEVPPCADPPPAPWQCTSTKAGARTSRLDRMRAESPLLTRHDRAGNPGAPLTSHAFVKNLKRYAKDAGIGDIHLHQTRHTYARIVAEETGSMIETQDALGHKNLATTRVYVQRIAIKKDKTSRKVAARLGL